MNTGKRSVRFYDGTEIDFNFSNGNFMHKR